MRYTGPVDRQLITDATLALGTKTRRETIEAALKQVVRDRRRQQQVRELHGSVQPMGDADIEP